MSFGGEVTKFNKERAGEFEEQEQKVEYLIIYIADQIFGIPVLQIQDVLSEQKVTRVPLAPPEVAGALNLRGRIVTAINVRKRLGLPENDDNNPSQKKMSVVVEDNNELYSLIIDKVGDVHALNHDDFEETPPTMDVLWRDISNGIHRLDDRLLVILDVPKLLRTVQ